MAPGTRRGLKQTVSISCLAIFGVKCNTFKKIMAGMENWETISLVAIAKQVPGVGYMAAQQQHGSKKIHLLQKTHTHTV